MCLLLTKHIQYATGTDRFRLLVQVSYYNAAGWSQGLQWGDCDILYDDRERREVGLRVGFLRDEMSVAHCRWSVGVK